MTLPLLVEIPPYQVKYRGRGALTPGPLAPERTSFEMQPDSSTRVTVRCGVCGAEFSTSAYRLRDGRGKFCSRACKYAAPPRRPLAERFWAKVDQSGGPDACWPWKGLRDAKGYGRFAVGPRVGRASLAHRVAWELTNGPIPDETPCVLHRCDNPPCCNPVHLFLGTQLDNVADMWEKGRADISGLRYVRVNIPRQFLGVCPDKLRAALCERLGRAA